MKLLVSLFIAFSLGCASVIPPEREDQMQTAIYQKRFAEASQGRFSYEEVKSIPIYIKPYKKINWDKFKLEYDDSVDGVCYPFGPFAFITISEKWWYSNFNSLRREQLIFHEIAHCIMLRQHTFPTSSGGFTGWLENTMFDLGIHKEKRRYLPDFCPSSYMHPSLISDLCIELHYNYYINELFERIENP